MGPRRRQSAAARGYDARWRRAREAYLTENPWCVYCERAGRFEPATVVDHIEPHRGDMELFWDRSNWQGLCAPCHDGPKKELESSGTMRGCDVDGVPLDPNHHWA